MSKRIIALGFTHAVIIALALAGISVLVYLTGTESVAVHFYYLPILYAAYVFGDYGAIIVALLAAAVCGPWMPAEVFPEVKEDLIVRGTEEQGLVDVLVRPLMFFIVGIVASRTFSELRRRIREAENLYEVARSVTSTLRLRGVLDRITENAVHVTNSKASSIRLLDPESEELELEAQHGLSEEYAEKGPVSLTESALDRQVIDGAVVQIPDVATDERWQYPEAATRENIRAVLSVPLISKEEARGVIRIYSEKRKRFNTREVELIQAFAYQAAIAIENAELYENLKDSYYETVRSLTIAIEAKDTATYTHSERVTELAIQLAKHMGIDDEEDLEMMRFGTILHDIGKIGVGEQYLSEVSGEAEPEQQLFYEMHPLIGRSILQPVSFLERAIPIVAYHHEQWDGNGYPEELEGPQIPLMARIVGLVNRFDRLMHPEDARQGLSRQEAVAQVLDEAGSRFDPEVVAAFNRMMRSAPTTDTEKHHQPQNGTLSTDQLSKKASIDTDRDSDDLSG